MDERMTFLSQPVKCYHKTLESVFEVIRIDYDESVVTVKKTAINSSDGLTVHLAGTYPFSEIVLLADTGKADDGGRHIVEHDAVAYGDGLQWTGIVKWSASRLTWIIESTQNNDQLLSEIGSPYLHIMASKGKG